MDLGWEGLFTFSEILKIAQHYEVIHLKGKELKILEKTRNKVAHSDKPLVEEKRDVAEIVKSLELCRGILSKSA